MLALQTIWAAYICTNYRLIDMVKQLSVKTTLFFVSAGELLCLFNQLHYRVTFQIYVVSCDIRYVTLKMFIIFIAPVI